MGCSQGLFCGLTGSKQNHGCAPFLLFLVSSAKEILFAHLQIRQERLLSVFVFLRMYYTIEEFGKLSYNPY